MDLQVDAPRLVAQLERVVGQEPPPANVRAVYFGLFERADAPSGPALYVSGSTRPVDDPDWAGWDEDFWLPEGRYFDLPELVRQEPSEWEAIHDAVAALLRGAEPHIAALLGTSEGRPIAVGWDDGEAEVLYVAKLG